jgi:hypothetical protein
VGGTPSFHAREGFTSLRVWIPPEADVENQSSEGRDCSRMPADLSQFSFQAQLWRLCLARRRCLDTRLLRANVGAVFNRIKDARAEEKKNRNEGCQHKAGGNGVIGAASAAVSTDRSVKTDGCIRHTSLHTPV